MPNHSSTTTTSLPSTKRTNRYGFFPSTSAISTRDSKDLEGDRTLFIDLADDGRRDFLPDEGDVRIDGMAYHFRTPADALAAGVGMVHQEFRLVPSFTVAENVVLGACERIVRRSAVESAVGALAERFGLATEPDRPVWQLSMGERQRVEILKVLFRGARIIILDEPTAVLTPQETDDLLSVLPDGGLHLKLSRHTKPQGAAGVVIAIRLPLEVRALRRGIGGQERRGVERRAQIQFLKSARTEDLRVHLTG